MPIKGKLNTPSPNADPLGSFTLVRRAPLTNISGEFTVDADAGVLIDGVLEDGVSSPAGFTARRAHWSTKTKAVDYAFAHTAALRPAVPVEEHTERPQGDGFMTLTVTTAGTATWGGRLADGSTLTGSAPLGEQGHVPLYQTFHTHTGSVMGWTQITGTNLDGTLEWFKGAQPAKSTARHFKDGFPLHDLTVIGGRYTAPARGELVLGLDPLAAPNAGIAFEDGVLTGPSTHTFTITPAHTTKVSVSAADLRLTFVAAKGTFSGSFKTGTPARKADLFGVIVPRLNSGAGFFLLPEAPVPPQPATKTPIWSGAVTLGAP